MSGVPIQLDCSILVFRKGGSGTSSTLEHHRQLHLTYLYLSFSSGQQIIISTCSDDAASSTQPIQILDFSRHPEPKMSTDETTILRIGRDSPTYILRPSPFEEDVLTYLPYHRLIRTSLEPCRLFMMDEHRIIGVTVRKSLLDELCESDDIVGV